MKIGHSVLRKVERDMSFLLNAALIYVTLFLSVLRVFFITLGVVVGWMAYVRGQGQAAVESAAFFLNQWVCGVT